MFNIKSIGIITSVIVMLLSPFTSWWMYGGQAPDVKENEETKKDTVKEVSVKLYSTSTGEISELDFEEYICGVLLAEVPEYFEEEALKAMAVASRTYCYRRLDSEEKYTKHFSADLCDDYTHCLGYISRDEASRRWGQTAATEYYEKIKNVVEQTRGEILYYGGIVADTVFHASSSDYTEDAKNIWGYDVPYLVSVSTPEQAALSNVEYTADEFRDILQSEGVYCDFTDNISEWVKTIDVDERGRVRQVNICDCTITGRRMREIFSLKSTNFTLVYEGEKFKFSVKGNGHGVGMSQYGCQQFAKGGMGYKEILAHYYQNTELGLY